MRRPTPLSQSSGVILIGALMTLFFFMVISLAIAEFGSSHYLSARRTLAALNALSVAEAGVDKFMHEINLNSGYAGSGGAVTFYSDSTRGRATYESTVENGSISGEKIVTSTGKIYLPASASTPLVTRKIKATIVGTASTDYTVMTGPSGLILTNSAAINGDVYVNGRIEMSNSSRIGSTARSVNVYAANANCPVGGGPSYPSVCTNGQQPISVNSPAHIYATVRATGQTNGTNMSSPGLVGGSTADLIDLPDDSEARTTQINAVATTMAGSSASCNGTQTRTIQANTKINGDFNISNSCVVTVKGDVWITGNLTLSNSAIFRVDPAVSSLARVMIDGSTGITLLNSSSVATNSSGVGFKFLTYYSAAPCSPDCGSVTGSDLYNSRDITTITLNNNVLAAGSIFYARWTKVLLSNAGAAGSVMGQTVQLSNSGNVSLGSISGGGTGTSWDVRYYQQSFQ